MICSVIPISETTTTESIKNFLKTCSARMISNTVFSIRGARRCFIFGIITGDIEIPSIIKKLFNSILFVSVFKKS